MPCLKAVIGPRLKSSRIGITDKETAKMIEYKNGDILKEDADALVNTVNCVGVMGRGIAFQFKNAFPKNFETYHKACTKNEVQPGKMFVFETGEFTNPRFIINFPTKRHWRGKSRMEDIEDGLRALVETIRQYHIRSVAIPPLGSGLGGLEWYEVRPRIESALGNLMDVRVVIYEPKGAPEVEKMVHNRNVPAMTVGRAALVELMTHYLNGLLDPVVTLLEVHKLMYFLQEAGEPLHLKYTKALYGPYAENLRHVLNAIEGYFISGYADGGDAPGKELTLVPGAVKDAAKCLNEFPETGARLDKVANLVEGFESPFGLELLSTVHWILKNKSTHSIDDVVERTHQWNKRKEQFTRRQITLAVNVLSQKGWSPQYDKREEANNADGHE
jgi:O-acetyl-ADP-ribose deacetylase (regulator of RNase III)